MVIQRPEDLFSYASCKQPLHELYSDLADVPAAFPHGVV